MSVIGGRWLDFVGSLRVRHDIWQYTDPAIAAALQFGSFQGCLLQKRLDQANIGKYVYVHWFIKHEQGVSTVESERME